VGVGWVWGGGCAGGGWKRLWGEYETSR
jgi:hypothetical protein